MKTMFDEEIQKKSPIGDNEDEESVVLKKEAERKETEEDRDENGWVQDDEVAPGEDEEFEIQFQGDEDAN